MVYEYASEADVALIMLKSKNKKYILGMAAIRPILAVAVTRQAISKWENLKIKNSKLRFEVSDLFCLHFISEL
ncbi:MAG TPA: hypothetical protein H9735_05280 [Candidatus Anaerostipes excrementavium]|uniref:Uncharacterized protein n=1 Tax=Candidatus Anaerostipes excrementavium TaxID=2838463 RepID=A0A9D2B920_9FIRM|nr:hypothetical protein [uncultured Anaerostipes sp.]HIX67526.1 hypothetical protein [Candidatus Anaerostipes excrementavium]